MSKSESEDTGIVQTLSNERENARNVPQTMLLSVHDLVKMGLTRSMSYQLLNRDDMPVVQIGTRKFMHREQFLDWLQKSAEGKT
jgi:hypothetical protein